MIGSRCFSSLKSAVQGCIRHGHPARQSNAHVYKYSRRVLSTGTKPVDNAAEKSPVSFASLALMAITGGAVALYFNTQKEERLKEVSKNVTSVGKPALGGPFALVDIHGQPKTDASYQGKFALLYFGFTHCPDICPSELVKIGKVMDLLEKKGYGGLVKPVFISVDPSRDSIGQLRYYAQDFHPDIDYLTGTTEQVAAAAKAYRVYFSKAHDVDVDSEEEYLVDHSIVLYLVAPNGEFAEFYTQRTEVPDVIDRMVKQFKAAGVAK